jgi:hypothetical protein
MRILRRSSSSHNCLPLQTNSSTLGPNIHLRTLLSNTRSLCSSDTASVAEMFVNSEHVVTSCHVMSCHVM